MVEALLRHDPTFVALSEQMLGTTDPDAVAAVVLDGDLSKMSPDPSEVSTKGKLLATGKRKLARRLALPLGIGAATTAVTEGGKLIERNRPVDPNAIPQRDPFYVGKADVVAEVATFSKVDTDKRQVFGWASITHMNGSPVVDRQGDVIDLEEVEKSAYDYVVSSRVGGDQHRRDGDRPFHAADLIESFVVTPDKATAMGLPDDMPQGWWVGFKVNDDATWADVKAGRKTGFSVHGRGKREVIDGDLYPQQVSQP